MDGIRNVVKRFIVLVSIAGICGCQTTSMAPAGRSQGEIKPLFSNYQILPEEVLKGSNYWIAAGVPVEEYQYVFTVDSDFGTITARGRQMLGLRLGELKSIEAARQLSRDPVLVDGILTPLKDTQKGLELILNEPFESLDRTPEGLKLMASQYTDPADRRAGSPDRRNLAVKLNCDPETANPVLKKLLDEMTLELFTGSLATQAAMSFVPGLGVPATTAQMKELITNKPPSVINNEIDGELEAAGVQESVRTRFHMSAAFTTLQRLQLMDPFRALEGVRNREALIERAAQAYNEADALSSIREGMMLADIHKKRPIRKLEFVGLSRAQLTDETQVLVCPYDYLTNTQELAGWVNGHRMSNPNVPAVFVTAGRVSPLARKTIEGAGIRIVEEGTNDW
jgi:hypothetical protein